MTPNDRTETTGIRRKRETAFPDQPVNGKEYFITFANEPVPILMILPERTVRRIIPERKFFASILLLGLSFFIPSVAGHGQSVPSERVIRILAVGNSFSDDGVEFLDELAQGAGIRLVVGNLYIGGCSLERHWNNVCGELPAYDYRKNDEGIRTDRPTTSLQEALQDEPWDYITIQQVSQQAGLYDTYYPYLPRLLQYLKTHATNPDVRFAIHQVWAYACDSDHPGFANYDNDQNRMYWQIVKTAAKAARKENIPLTIPSGTAVQTGRNLMGDRMNRDGFHLDYGLGRYIAACTWFETFFGPVEGNPYRPESISPQEAALAQRIAHAAVLHPARPGVLK